jgi:Mn-containing catalase
LYNLMLESTGRLQKCRIYEMTDNKTARSTIAYLIVRDQAHENAFAKALESLGVNWGAALPIPKTNAEQFPEVKNLLDMGLQSIQYRIDAKISKNFLTFAAASASAIRLVCAATRQNEISDAAARLAAKAKASTAPTSTCATSLRLSASGVSLN